MLKTTRTGSILISTKNCLNSQNPDGSTVPLEIFVFLPAAILYRPP